MWWLYRLTVIWGNFSEQTSTSFDGCRGDGCGGDSW